MSARIRVTADELKRHWMSPDATGMIHDQQTQSRVVVMADGTHYETPFSEITESLGDAS